MKNPIRWKQRFENFKKTLLKLAELTDSKSVDSLSEIERDSLIKRFELTYELAWNVLKDFLEYQGDTGLQGSRGTFRLAFQRGLIGDGEIWMEMIETSIQSAQFNDETMTNEIVASIYSKYLTLFKKLEEKLDVMITDPLYD